MKVQQVNGPLSKRANRNIERKTSHSLSGNQYLSVIRLLRPNVVAAVPTAIIIKRYCCHWSPSSCAHCGPISAGPSPPVPIVALFALVPVLLYPLALWPYLHLSQSSCTHCGPISAGLSPPVPIVALFALVSVLLYPLWPYLHWSQSSCTHCGPISAGLSPPVPIVALFALVSVLLYPLWPYFHWSRSFCAYYSPVSAHLGPVPIVALFVLV